MLCMLELKEYSKHFLLQKQTIQMSTVPNYNNIEAVALYFTSEFTGLTLYINNCPKVLGHPLDFEKNHLKIKGFMLFSKLACLRPDRFSLQLD